MYLYAAGEGRTVNIRDVLLLIYGIVWGLVVIITKLQAEPISPELWAALGAGVGIILALFSRDQPKDPPA